VIRRPTAAPDDQEFSASARAISSNIALGHVRQASVGDLCVANAHPFVFGPWLFMHNGTVTGFDKIRSQLVEETDADLRGQVAGTTDSEQVFFWLLSRLRRAGQPPEAHCRDVMLVMRAMAAAIRTLAERSAATQPAEPTRLNFVLSDGRVFVASRWKHTLYWTNHASPLAASTDAPLNPGVMVASETIGGEPWSEVPDRHILAVDAEYIVRWLAI
jgi:glutamine amidotransferase